MGRVREGAAKILGALLTAVSLGLKRLPYVKLERLPRMADLTKWVTACEPALWKPGTFVSAYNANRMEAIETVIEADPVATGLRDFMATKTVWTGTASELLGSLSLIVTEAERRGKLWPAAPNRLSGRLRRQATFLRQVGIKIEQKRSDKAGTRMLIITREERVGKGSSEPSGPSDGGKSTYAANDLASDDTSDDRRPSDDTPNLSSERNPLKYKASDDTDASDDKSPTSSPLCAHCGKPGGLMTAYGDRQAFVHPHCRQAWIAAQEGVLN